jgi:hypothetical protein
MRALLEVAGVGVHGDEDVWAFLGPAALHGLGNGLAMLGECHLCRLEPIRASPHPHLDELPVAIVAAGAQNAGIVGVEEPVLQEGAIFRRLDPAVSGASVGEILVPPVQAQHFVAAQLGVDAGFAFQRVEPCFEVIAVDDHRRFGGRRLRQPLFFPVEYDRVREVLVDDAGSPALQRIEVKRWREAPQQLEFLLGRHGQAFGLIEGTKAILSDAPASALLAD